MTTLKFSPSPNAGAAHTVFLGPRPLLSPSSLAPHVPSETHAALAAVEAEREKTAKTWVGDKSYTFLALEEKLSRNLGHVRGDLVQSLVEKNIPAKEDVQLNLLLTSESQALAATNAIARALPLYNRKSSPSSSRTLTVTLSTSGNTLSAETHASLASFATAVREAARLCDTPTSELNTTALVKEVEAVASNHSNTVKATIITGDDLLKHGLRALHGVGRAASHPPSLAVLSYTPSSGVPKNSPVLALVGKGIVYDTGGLSLKVPYTNMMEMKSDMGAAGALLSAFSALVSSPTPPPFPIVFIGCIAENAIGPLAQRPDDVVIAHSGLSIEINNTDAEGRLVLADGVSWATTSSDIPTPTHIIDMATLTGSQLTTTGLYHAGLMTPSASFESLLSSAGHTSGDWVFPILYAPELLNQEYDSHVADMKNSMKNVTNAASSCGGHFVERHLSPGWKGEWAHVDMPGPCFRMDTERCTGFGVGLVWETVRLLGEKAKNA